MNCICNAQDRKSGGMQQQEVTEDQFFEQFAALEDGLALVQIQLRGLSENAELFGGLVRQLRRSTYPVPSSPKYDERDSVMQNLHLHDAGRD